MNGCQCRAWIFLLSISLLLNPGCKRTSGGSSVGASSSASPVLLDDEGTYTLDPGGYRLTITREPDGRGRLVAFALQAPDSDAIVRSAKVGADSSRWYFCWSLNEELWVYSGDAGVTGWARKQGEIEFQPLSLDDAAAVQRMPSVFFDALPQSLKQRWSPMRR